MIDKDLILKILNDYSEFNDLSRTDKCVMECNFNSVANEIINSVEIPITDEGYSFLNLAKYICENFNNYDGKSHVDYLNDFINKK